MLNAAKTLNQNEHLSTHTVLLADCKSLLESLQSEEENNAMRDIKTELTLLSNETVLCLQCIEHEWPMSTHTAPGNPPVKIKMGVRLADLRCIEFEFTHSLKQRVRARHVGGWSSRYMYLICCIGGKGVEMINACLFVGSEP